MSGFTLEAIGKWAKRNLVPGARVTSDGHGCFAAVTTAGCLHTPVVVGQRKPKDFPDFEWVNTILGNGFRCPRCKASAHYVVGHGARRRYECTACKQQTSLTAGSLMDNTKLPLTVWFLAIYLISQAKTGISSLALKRHLGVSYPTAWLLHQKINRAMAAQDATHRLAGSVQLDDAYLGGERAAGKAGRGSENKVPFVAAVSLNGAGHPLCLKLALVSGFTWRRSASAPKPASPPAPVS